MNYVKNPFLEYFQFPASYYNSRFGPVYKNSLNESFDLFQKIQGSCELLYLDSASSTFLDRRVFEFMEPWLLSYAGNGSHQIHGAGALSWHGIAWAREQIAQVCQANYENVIFTSCATESNNAVLRGLIEHPFRKRNKIIYAATEHSSIVATAKALEEHYGKTHGVRAVPLSVDANGQIILEEARRLIDDQTLVVCVMDVNNETGAVQGSLKQVEEIAHGVGSLLHVDAVQGFARTHQIAGGVDYDFAVISSSKIYGPKGASALIVKSRRPRIRLAPQLVGGGQEFQSRSGTHNTANIMGFAKACLLQKEESLQRMDFYARMEKIFQDEITSLAKVEFFVDPLHKCSGILSFAMPHVNAMKAIEDTGSVCVSVGSACKTLQATASHVLLAMGVDFDKALSTIRVSFGLSNTEEEVRLAAQKLGAIAKSVQ